MSIYPYTLAGIFTIQYNRIFSCHLFFEGSQWFVTNDSLVCDIYKVSIIFITSSKVFSMMHNHCLHLY
jgi:hypothetical protein